MKTLLKVTLILVLVTLFNSCQSDSKDILSNKEMRMGIMDSIANNHEMSTEMMNKVVNSEHGKMTIQGNSKLMMMMTGNTDAMGKMLKENPAMMQNMMSSMMDAAKGDSTMMSGMVKSMMGNPQMMKMMQMMMGGNMGMNMNGGNTDMNNKEGMNNMGGMNKKK